MKSRRLGRGMGQNVYSHDYHLSRAVRCVDCDALLHKTHQYVQYGNRCIPCYQAIQVVGGNTRS